MKKNCIKLISLTIALLILLSPFSFAISNSSIYTAGVEMPKLTTEEYKNWKKLTDEEKENTIEPSAFSVELKDSTKRSIISGTTSVVAGGTLPSSYAIVDSDKIEPLIKNQKGTQECWAFSTTSIIETNLAKTRNKNLRLSPRHIDYATARKNSFISGENLKGYNREVGSGNFYVSMGYCTRGQGPVLYESMPFEDNENKIELSDIDIEPVLKVENYAHFADVHKDYSTGSVRYYDGTRNELTKEIKNEYSLEDVNKIRELVKNHLMNYGAVSGYMHISGDLFSYISTESGHTAYFNNSENNSYNHAVTIIGWDDNFSKDNFRADRKPEHDGAYIVLNTSTADYEELSILYISYDDVWIESNNFGIVSTTDIDYDNIYQYDDYGYNMPVNLTVRETGKAANVGYIANVFNSNKKEDKDEYINEVSLYLPVTSNVDIYLNTANDNKSSLTKMASSDVLDVGYHTIKLSTPVKITGDKFVVAAKLTTDAVAFGTECNFHSNGEDSNIFDYATSNVGEGFYSLDATNWNDLCDPENGFADTSICLKAFTTYQDKPVIDETVHVESISLDKNKIELKEGESATLVASITPSNADNKNITWKSSDTNVATVSSTGIIKAVKEGTATITATTVDGEKVATCIVNVKGEIAKEDEIYYQDDDNEIDNNQNGGNTNVDSNTNANTNTSASTNTSADTTRATGKIPQTGERTIIITTMFFVVILGIVIVYIKVRNMKDIK